ncbi:hypothetical protein FGB62_227g012 [Gracilaria domingensis]|nr:hypothetical protein FGB62_227g012 [Gracilaria domingensis]
MRTSSTAIINLEDESGEREPTRRKDAFRRKSWDIGRLDPGSSCGGEVSPSTSSLAAWIKGKPRVGANPRYRVLEYATRHSVLSYVAFGLALHIVLSLAFPRYGIPNIHKRRREESRKARYTNSLIPSSLPEVPNITILTTGFDGYSNTRQKELHLVAFRNTNLGLRRYHRLCDPHCRPIYSTDTNVSSRNVNSEVTYADLFREANNFVGSIVAIVNADIYFDHSIYCAGLIDKGAVLALSRHPSPDCISSAMGASGREPVDICGGYDPKWAASHDGFIFVPPVAQQVIDGLAGLRVNEFGAENVVVHMLQQAGLNVVNPCERIHLFHQHCGDERASAAKKRRTDRKWGRLFASTKEWGYGGSSWIREEIRATYGTVDCTTLGLLMQRKSKGLH